jgi:hypothetical protein
MAEPIKTCGECSYFIPYLVECGCFTNADWSNYKCEYVYATTYEDTESCVEFRQQKKD